MTKVLFPSAMRISGHAFVTTWLNRESVIVDLGFNEGVFTGTVVDRFGCRVYATEPLPSLRAAAQPLPRVHLDGVAIAGTAGDFVLHDNPQRCATLETKLAEPGALAVPVQAVTLETFLCRLPAGSEVALLKVDIEGAEVEVLLTASDTTLMRIRQLTIEFHDFIDPTSGPAVSAAVARLARLGFTHVRFGRDNADVLFIRADLLRLASVARLWLVGRYKLPWGAARMVRRRSSRRWRNGASVREFRSPD